MLLIETFFASFFGTLASLLLIDRIKIQRKIRRQAEFLNNMEFMTTNVERILKQADAAIPKA